MENTLIMNKLPLPRYYDGNEWNTKLRPTRKSIPKYLHQDLPELKLLELKERFKQVGKFNCPKLEYFNDFIKKRKSQYSKQKQKHQSLRQSYQQVKEQFQYALLIFDRQSPVIDDLVTKARSVKKEQGIRAQRSEKSKQKGRYFQGTIDLVFRNRKNLFLSQMDRMKPDQSNSEAAAKVQQIELIPFT